MVETWLEEWLMTFPGVTKDYKEEWGWWRYQVGGKLFAAVCQPGPEHAGYDCRKLISLKCDPERAILLRAEFADIVPASLPLHRRSPAGSDRCYGAGLPA